VLASVKAFVEATQAEAGLAALDVVARRLVQRLATVSSLLRASRPPDPRIGGGESSTDGTLPGPAGPALRSG